MAKGFDKVEKAIKDIEARKNASGDYQSKTYFRVSDKNPEVVRFFGNLESAWVHILPPTKDKQWGEKVVCIDQDENLDPKGVDCPGCEKRYRRSYRGVINVIWRNGPVYEKDENGRFVKDNLGKKIQIGEADQIAVWMFGSRVADSLAQINKKYKGIDSRDFEIIRSGEGKETKYSILPADVDGGPQPLSKEDEMLLSEAYDLSEFSLPPTYEDWGKAWTPPEKDDVAPSETSPFLRNRTKV